MGMKQKIYAGTMLGSTGLILIGTFTGMIPLAIIGGIGIGLSCRKRMFFKKKKPKKEKKEKKSFFRRRNTEPKRQPLINEPGADNHYSGKIDGTY